MKHSTQTPPSTIKFAKAAEFKCKQCGAFHGGLYSTRICPDCWKKGHR